MPPPYSRARRVGKESHTMNYIHLHSFVSPPLLEESRRELEREAELQRHIREARHARRAARPSRFTALLTQVRSALKPAPCPRLVEDR
jgi:hypothetical protein